MDDPLRFIDRDEDDLKERAGSTRSDHQHSQLPVVFLLDVSDRIVDRVEHVVVGDPVLSRAICDLKRHHIEYDPVRQ
ncbi:hypothetical protein [Microbacterium sp.]|uniref:hypothetical protein n=1 Tax=Microbacterium sp. TaxID=51671 RepID=UPI0039E3D6E4